MKRFFLFLTLSTLSIGAARATTGDAESPAARIPEAAAILEGLEPNVTVVGEPGWNLEERMAHYNVKAVSLAVIEDYEIVWAEAFGLADAEEGIPATAETLFMAGSISKPVGAAAVMAAAQEGKLDLDAPINSILTSWTLPENEFTAESDVTPRRLLNHTAGTTVHGFAGYAIDADVPTTVQVLEGTPPTSSPPVRVDFVPGSQYRYSGGGSTVMQRALRGDEGTLLRKEMVEEMITPGLGGSGLGCFQVDWGGGPLFSHGGSVQGFGAFFAASHEGGRGLALMANSDNFIGLALEIRHAITRAFEWPDVPTDPIVASDVTAEKLDALAGRYLVRDDRVIELTRQGERLMSRGLLGSSYTWWIPTAEGTFITQNDGNEFRFQRDDTGAVTGYFRVDEQERRVRPRLPGDFESYVTLLDADRTGDAIVRLRADGMDEVALNELGYLLLNDKPEQAVAVFQLAVELHPGSANASDSLGDGYVAIGDTEAAVESFRLAAEKLAADNRIPEEPRPSYEARARTMIRRHGGS